MSTPDAAPGPVGRALDSARNLLATLLALGRTRLELLTVELQLEVRRSVEVAAWLLIAIQAAMIGLIMIAFLLIVIFWDEHRVLVASLVTGGFLLVACVAGLTVAGKLRRKPRMLAGTLAELSADAERLRGQP